MEGPAAADGPVVAVLARETPPGTLRLLAPVARRFASSPDRYRHAPSLRWPAYRCDLRFSPSCRRAWRVSSGVWRGGVVAGSAPVVGAHRRPPVAYGAAGECLAVAGCAIGRHGTRGNRAMPLLCIHSATMRICNSCRNCPIEEILYAALRCRGWRTVIPVCSQYLTVGSILRGNAGQWFAGRRRCQAAPPVKTPRL